MPVIRSSIILLVCVITVAGCGTSPEERQVREGKSLAATYCASCHLFPEPSLLDRKSWLEGVLPRMGPRLGIFSFNGRSYPSDRYEPAVKDLFPSKAVLSPEQWAAILKYYDAMAPDSLSGQARDRPIDPHLSLFSAKRPAGAHDHPVAAFVGFDTSFNKRRIIAGTLLPSALLRYDEGLRLVDSVPVSGAVVDIDGAGDSAVACNIGVINPNNGRSGSVSRLMVGDKTLKLDSVALFGNLARPVQVVSADLNGDGRMDYLIAEFGNLKGALSWMENDGKGGYQRHVLREAPGAIRMYVQDYNHDGLPDIWVLFAQGDENITLFTNKGKGEFDQQVLLRFPPLYGSSYFELDDLNKDGLPDILYTCGDNADYSQVLKPYHGVYIYLNDGANHFRQAWFYPINGCYKAMARDFDGDGDLDIATIAFFADYVKQPEEGFVYFENLGNLQFRPSSLPEAKSGRWISMDVGDIDGDGRPDILLGNFSVGPALLRGVADWKKGPLFLLLHNEQGAMGRSH